MDARKEMGNPQPTSIIILDYYGVQFIDYTVIGVIIINNA
jgi:hypothetical protein